MKTITTDRPDCSPSGNASRSHIETRPICSKVIAEVRRQLYWLKRAFSKLVPNWGVFGFHMVVQYRLAAVLLVSTSDLLAECAIPAENVITRASQADAALNDINNPCQYSGI